MKKLLKYLLPLIVTAVFCNLTDGHASVVAEDSVADFCIDAAAAEANISAADSEICLPRPVSFANSHRVQNAPRRTAGAHRVNVEFTKSGKIVNADLRYFIQRKSIIVHSSLVEPSHKLLCLGRLII